MLDPRLAGLTELEKQALRALHKHRYLSTAAKAIGLSDSGIRNRLESAVKRSGVGRWDLAVLLGQQEGWLPHDTDPVSQQPLSETAAAEALLAPSAEDERIRLGEARPVFDYGPPAPSLPWMPRLTRNGAGRNDLTAGRRMAAIGIWCLIALVVFCLLIATMSALGTFGLHLSARGVTRV